MSQSRARPRRDRTVLLDKPPGLGRRPRSSGVEKALQKEWTSLSKEVQDALKAVGIDYTPEPELQPLEEILKTHIEALPKEVKDAVETLIAPVKQEPSNVTTQLKTTVWGAATAVQQEGWAAETGGQCKGAVQDTLG